MRSTGRIGFTVVTVALFWLATAIAASTLWPVYEDLSFAIAAGGALVLGTVVAVLGAAFRWPSVVVLLVGVIVFLVAGVPLAVPSKAINGIIPTLQGEIDLITGVALGWKQLLTIMLPVGDYQSLLVPPFAAVLVATIVGLSIALRAKWGELGAIPPVLLFLTGILFGPEVAARPVPLALGMLVAILIWMVWRRAYRRRTSILRLARQAADASGGKVEVRGERSVGVRAILSATLILAIAVGVSVAATQLLPPTERRQVLRTAVYQPFDPRDYPSPLAGLRRYLREDRSDSEMLRISGVPAGTRVRIATLDSYDGVVYTVGSAQVDSDSGTFVRVPTTIDETSVPGTPIAARVEVRGYSDVWLPTIGALESVSFEGATAPALQDAFYYNRTGRTAAVIGGIGDGVTYDLRAVVPTQPTEAQLQQATPGTARVPKPAVLPDEVSEAVERYARSVEGAGSQLEAVITGLRNDGYISHGISPDEPASRSGHAADRITQLFADNRMIGDAEQYSVAAALMAGQLGFPARVVYGFLPTEESGTLSLRGSDITAWIEVDTAEYGWVTVDPVPPVRPIPEEQPDEPAPIARPQFPAQQQPEDPEPRTEQSPPDATQEDQNDPSALLAILLVIAQIVGWSALALLVLSSPLLVVLAAKARRRRLRRTAPGAVERISGAWDQFRDDAVDRGIAPTQAATRVEFADTVGLQQSKTLAAVADRAVFGPEETEMAEADRVWLAMEDLGESLDRGRTRWQRFRARISVRSLGGRGVRRIFGRGTTTRGGER